MNTHSRYGDRRMEILSACARTVGFPEADALLPMNTTEEAADFLYEHGYLKQVMEQVANQVKAVLEEESGVQTEEMCIRDRDNGKFFTSQHRSAADFDRSFYFLIFQRKIAKRFIAHQHRNLIGQGTEFVGSGVLVAEEQMCIRDR